MNEEVSLQLQHTSNSNSLKLGCAPELVGILEQGAQENQYDDTECSGAKRILSNLQANGQ